MDVSLTPFDKSRKIWDAIYKSVGRELPNFFSNNLEETQMQESLEDNKGNIMNALESWIIDKCRLDMDKDTKIINTHDSTERLNQLVCKKLVSCVKIGRDGRFIFYRQIIAELEHYGVKQIDLPSLADAIPGAEYIKSHGCRVVKCSRENLINFFQINT